MAHDRDTYTLMSGPRVTLVRQWDENDEYRATHSYTADQVHLLPLVQGAMLIVVAGEVAIRATMTREEFWFLLGGTVATIKTRVEEWFDEYERNRAAPDDTRDADGA